ncbi:MAG: hypothetical protein KC587_08040 [Nitrospira sp.]|nr:hypothetical protein [Nitrospira sp.]MCA9456599.1 hypothetical protein [Nitrospira sp.]
MKKDVRQSISEQQRTISQLETGLAEKTRHAQRLMEDFPGNISMDKLLSAQREAAEAKERLAEAQEELLSLQRIDDPAFVQAKQEIETLPEAYTQKVAELHQLEQAAVDCLNPLHELFLSMRSVEREIGELGVRYENAHVALGINQKHPLVRDIGVLFRSTFTFADFLNRFMNIVLTGHLRPQKSIAFHEHG